MSCQPVPDSYKQAIFPKFLTHKKIHNLIDFLLYLISSFLIGVLQSEGVLVFLVFSFSGLLGFLLMSPPWHLLAGRRQGYLLCH